MDSPGKQEAQREIAKNLLKSGIDPKVVLTATHLTLAQIEELQHSMN